MLRRRKDKKDIEDPKDNSGTSGLERTPRLGVLQALSVLFVLSAAQALAAPPEPPGFKLNGNVERGRQVFLKRCATCHGPAGDGRGTLAASLKVKPTDFTAPGTLAKRSGWEVYVVTRDGGPALGLSSAMFGWSKLVSDQEIRDAAAYVRSLAPPP